MSSKIKSKEYYLLCQFVEETSIASYLKDEIKKILGYFGRCKIVNILENRGFFLDYLLFIDKKNTLLLKQRYNKKYILSHRICNYISDYSLLEQGVSLQEGQDSGCFCMSRGFISAITAVRGFLLLTLEEFCHATPTRIAINKMIFSKNKVIVL